MFFVEPEATSAVVKDDDNDDDDDDDDAIASCACAGAGVRVDDAVVRITASGSTEAKVLPLDKSFFPHDEKPKPLVMLIIAVIMKSCKIRTIVIAS